MAKFPARSRGPKSMVDKEDQKASKAPNAAAVASLHRQASSRGAAQEFLRQRSLSGSFRITSTSGWQQDEAIAGMRDTIDWGTKTPSVCVQATMIHPSSRFRVMWDLAMMCVILALCLYLPFQLAFEDTHPDDFRFALAVDAVLVVVFSLDMIVNCKTGFHEDDSGTVVMDPWRSFLVYLRFWFFIDLAATVPWDWVVSSSVDDSAANVPRLLRALKLYRVAKLARLLRLFRVFRLRSTLKETLEDLNVDRNLVSLMALLLQVLSVAHLLSCGFFFVAQLEGNGITKTWVGAQHLADASIARQYLTAFYYVVALQTSVGLGDVVSETDAERVYSIGGMLIAAGVYGYAIAKMSYLVSEMNVERRTYNQKMNEVQAYMELRHIPHDLRVQIRQYFKYSLARRTVYDERAVMEMLSTQLQKDVARHMQQMVSDIPFFDGAETRFVRAVLPLLKPVFFAAKQGILREGTFGTDMYFIKKGTVRVVLDKGIDHEIPIAVLTDGALFGEMALMLDEQNSRRCATVRAITGCETFTAGWMDLRPILMEFSDVLEKTLDESIKRSRETSSKRRRRAWTRAKSVRNPWVFARQDSDGDLEGTRVMNTWTKALEQTVQAPAKLRVQNMVTAATIEQVFAQFDVDQSGAIDRSEYEAMLPMLGFRLSPSLQRTIYEIIDNNGNESIDLEEFRAAMLVLQRFQAMHRDALEEKFEAETFAAHFKNVHSQSPEQQRLMQQQMMVAMAQQDEDMKIKYSENLKSDYEGLLAKHRECLQAARQERRRRKTAEAHLAVLRRQPGQAATAAAVDEDDHGRSEVFSSVGSLAQMSHGDPQTPTPERKVGPAALFRRTLSRWSSIGDGSRASPKRLQSTASMRPGSKLNGIPAAGMIPRGAVSAHARRQSHDRSSMHSGVDSRVLSTSLKRVERAAKSDDTVPNQDPGVDDAAHVAEHNHPPRRSSHLEAPSPNLQTVRLAPLPTRPLPAPKDGKNADRTLSVARVLPGPTRHPPVGEQQSFAVSQAGSVSAEQPEHGRRPRRLMVTVGIGATHSAQCPVSSVPPVHLLPSSGAGGVYSVSAGISAGGGAGGTGQLTTSLLGMDTVALGRRVASGEQLATRQSRPKQRTPAKAFVQRRRDSEPGGDATAQLPRQLVHQADPGLEDLTARDTGSGREEADAGSDVHGRSHGSGPVDSYLTDPMHVGSGGEYVTSGSDGSGSAPHRFMPHRYAPHTHTTTTTTTTTTQTPDSPRREDTHVGRRSKDRGTEFASLRSSSTGYQSVRPHMVGPGMHSVVGGHEAAKAGPVDQSPPRSVRPVVSTTTSASAAVLLPASAAVGGGMAAMETGPMESMESSGIGGKSRAGTMSVATGSSAPPPEARLVSGRRERAEQDLRSALGSMCETGEGELTGVTLPTVAPRSQDQESGATESSAARHDTAASGVGEPKTAAQYSRGTARANAHAKAPAGVLVEHGSEHGQRNARRAAATRLDLLGGVRRQGDSADKFDSTRGDRLRAVRQPGRRGSQPGVRQTNDSQEGSTVDSAVSNDADGDEDDEDDGESGQDLFTSKTQMQDIPGSIPLQPQDAQSERSLRSDWTVPFTAPADGAGSAQGRQQSDDGGFSDGTTINGGKRSQRMPLDAGAPIFDDGPTEPMESDSEATRSQSASGALALAGMSRGRPGGAGARMPIPVSRGVDVRRPRHVRVPGGRLAENTRVQPRPGSGMSWSGADGDSAGVGSGEEEEGAEERRGEGSAIDRERMRAASAMAQSEVSDESVMPGPAHGTPTTQERESTSDPLTSSGEEIAGSAPLARSATMVIATAVPPVASGTGSTLGKPGDTSTTTTTGGDTTDASGSLGMPSLVPGISRAETWAVGDPQRSAVRAEPGASPAGEGEVEGGGGGGGSSKQTPKAAEAEDRESCGVSPLTRAPSRGTSVPMVNTEAGQVDGAVPGAGAARSPTGGDGEMRAAEGGLAAIAGAQSASRSGSSEAQSCASGTGGGPLVPEYDTLAA